MNWLEISRNGKKWLQLDTDHGYITLEDQPNYAAKGRWLARMRQKPGLHNPWFDDSNGSSNGWPRYYFDLDRAKAEVEAWVEFREQIFKDKQAARRPKINEET